MNYVYISQVQNINSMTPVCVVLPSSGRYSTMRKQRMWQCNDRKNNTENYDALFKIATKNYFGILLDILRTKIISIIKLHSSHQMPLPFYFKHFTVLHLPLLYKVTHLMTFTSYVSGTKTCASFFCEPFRDNVHCFTRIRRGSDL